MHEHRGAAEPKLAALLQQMSPVDLVIVEGFKRDSFPKLEIHRPSLRKALLYPEDPDIVAVASDVALPGLPLPLLPLGDADAIAAFILAHCGIGAVHGAAER
jgi:molybdopterin-guanine dinucleotide biosynthesis protein MobB